MLYRYTWQHAAVEETKDDNPTEGQEQNIQDTDNRAELPNQAEEQNAQLNLQHVST